jgi:hypothetical protein
LGKYNRLLVLKVKELLKLRVCIFYQQLSY